MRLSLGVAGTNETEPGEVVALADQRMYADKAQWYAKHGSS